MSDGVDRPSPIKRSLIVISYYDRRTDQFLYELLESLNKYPAGAPFDVAVVVNSTGDRRLSFSGGPSPAVVYRQNLGMNIGAWDHGWRTFRDYDAYVFLQDECYVVRENWLSAILTRLSEPQIGFVGESLNPAWDAPWEELSVRHRKNALPDHFIDDKPAPRVETYLRFFESSGIAKGDGGAHLRSLIWAARREVLEEIGGFPSGRNFGECIAAEIGVSKKIQSAGLKIAQIASAPFFYIRHREYNQDYPGQPFTHGPVRSAHGSKARAIQDARAMNGAGALNSLMEQLRGFWRRFF